MSYKALQPGSTKAGRVCSRCASERLSPRDGTQTTAVCGWPGCRPAHGILSILLLFIASVAFLSLASFPASADALSNILPTWTVGDWWIVESQVYDRGDRRPGAVPGWLDKEAWLFSVEATNSIDGEGCYQVTIKPKEPNRCPYWFTCWFRMSDLLVLRRDLHQPTTTRTGRPFAAPVAQANYSSDEPMPFMPSDFPNLPLAMPHFVGGTTNVYEAKASSAKSAAAPQGAVRNSPRSLARAVTQTFHPHEMLDPDAARGSGVAMPANPPGEKEHFGVLVLAESADKYERQHWNNALPWHVYGEKWEGGQMVRRSWLAGRGHATGAPADSPEGGGK